MKLKITIEKICFLGLILVFGFPVCLWSDDTTAKEKYEKKFIFDLKIDKSSPIDFFVDGKENYYVFHDGADLIEVFDENGSSIKK